MTSSPVEVAVRRAGPGDRDLLLDWANDPATRAASFHPGRIDPETHDRWFAARLASANGGIWIGEVDGWPIGQVRVTRVDFDWRRGEVSISLAAEARGRGLSLPLLLAAMTVAGRDLDVTTFVAAIRHGNAASRALFLGAGFSEEMEDVRNGVACTILAHVADPLRRATCLPSRCTREQAAGRPFAERATQTPPARTTSGSE